MSLRAGTRLGPYEITSSIGSGGMGEVYKARDTRLDRTVAIKVLPAKFAEDPALRLRMEREARAISSLDHPNICALYDVGRERPSPAPTGADRALDFLVMQHLEGETLAARLERGPMRIEEALRTGAEIADALAAAHRRGIVHRDLKPGNVMLTRTGTRLLDFGLAKQGGGFVEAGAPNDAVTVATPLTTERTIVGTPQYMAPEQLEGREVDARTDIFAFGAVLYEMLTGQRAFAADSSAGLIAAILSSQPPALTTREAVAPRSLARVVDRCLAKTPDDRWQSAADLAFELRALLHLAEPASVTPAQTVSRRIAALFAVALLVVASLVALAVLLPARAPASPAAEVRLFLLPPDGQVFTTDVADYNAEFALAPDGSKIAFTTTNERGERVLWARALGEFEARPLSGTTGARLPFWSPDSRSIAFFGPAGLMRVSLGGGAPQIVASRQSISGPGASWNPGDGAGGNWGPGRIIFDQPIAEARRGLAIVDETGGTPTTIAMSGGSQRYPVLLPDGRHFVYLNWTVEPAERAIFLGALDSEERTELVKSGFKAEFVEPDRLVYVRDRELVAQRLDLAGRRLIGEPLSVVTGLAMEAIPGQATFATSRSGVLAYRTRSRDVVSELKWIDRSGRVVESIGGDASDITVSLSPDGLRALTTRLIASSANEERLPANVWLLDLRRGVSTRVTLDAAGVDENPIWSPDGRSILFASHRTVGVADVRLLGATESGAGRVVASGALNFHPIDWSPDGRTILLHAYGTGAGSDNIDLWVLAADGRSEPQPFVQEPSSQAQGQFSPDGRWLAYTSEESGRVEVYVRRFPSGDGRWQASSAGGAQPRWRGDSRELYYVSPSGALMAVPVSGAGEFSAGVPVPLFTEPSLRVNNSAYFYGGAAAYDVDRDGQRFLVTRLKREPSAGPIRVVLNGLPR